MEPQLWSLYDMLRFYGAAFSAVVANLTRAEAIVAMHAMGSDEPLPQDTQDKVGSILEDLRVESSSLPLSRSFYGQLKRHTERVQGAGSRFPYQAITIGFQELANCLTDELTCNLYLLVPGSEKGMYLEPENWFGRGTVDAFPDSSDDIRDCVRCLALDQWTAAVFFSMLIVERGLHWLAEELGVPFEQAQWKVVIDGIHKAIRDMEQEPRTPEREDRIELYSDLASHFFHFKGAWRNRVSHGHRRYDEDAARRIVSHVRDFMASIAGRVNI